MKVEYLIKLFNNFNKQIWTNKIFSYFLIIIIIGYTISLRNYPEIYYKYLYNPLVLLILICYILLIAKYNIPLGFMLTFSLIALYYPKNKNITEEITETFGNEEDDKITVPVYGEDKNIVDDTQKSTKKNKSTKNTNSNTKEDFENEDDEKEDFENEDDEKEDFENEDEDEEDEDDKKKKKSKERFTEDNDEVKEIGLEKLNPAYYKKNKNDSNNKKNNNNTKTKTKNITEKKNKKTEKEPKKEGETFIGDVRQVITDLDTGRGGMNASNAIKQINNLFYDKHKLNIKKIIDNDDDDSSESDDDDFF